MNMPMIRSFFSHFGILSICIITMAIFGEFGLRPSQTEYKCLCYFLDILLICNYSIICRVNIGELIVLFRNDVTKFPNLFNGNFLIVIVVIFTVWIIATFKKYNLFCLLEAIIDIRSTKLSKGHKIYIAAVIFIFGSMSISIRYAAFIFFLSTYTVHPILIVLMLVDLNITWMLFWNINLLLCANAFIISREFQKCNNDFDIGLSSNGSLFSDIFHPGLCLHS